MNKNISFILVQPQFGGNLGSVARAIKNFGFQELILVAPEVSVHDKNAGRMSAHAKDILLQAKIYPTFSEAIQDFRFLVGTTCRFGKHRKGFVDVSDIHTKLPKTGKTGIVFGAERMGLTNEELTKCHLLSYIPTDQYLSMNLAQAVQIYAYELRDRAHIPLGIKEEPPALMSDVEKMTGHFETMLETIRFIDQKKDFHLRRTLRSIFTRAQLSPRDVRIFHGVSRQVQWALKNPAVSVQVTKGK